MVKELILTSIFNSFELHIVQQEGGHVFTAMVSPFKWRPEPNLALFAASAPLVFGHMHGTGDLRWAKYPVVSDEQYTTEYMKLLDSRKEAIDRWLHKETTCVPFALCCSCKGGIWACREQEKVKQGSATWKFCHLDVLELWLWLQYGKTLRVRRV